VKLARARSRFLSRSGVPNFSTHSCTRDILALIGGASRCAWAVYAKNSICRRITTLHCVRASALARSFIFRTCFITGGSIPLPAPPAESRTHASRISRPWPMRWGDADWMLKFWNIRPRIECGCACEICRGFPSLFLLIRQFV